MKIKGLARSPSPTPVSYLYMSTTNHCIYNIAFHASYEVLSLFFWSQNVIALTSNQKLPVRVLNWELIKNFYRLLLWDL